MPLAVGDLDPQCPTTIARLHVSQLLAERGAYGLVWLDADLVVRRRYGRIVDFVETGMPVSQGLLPLVGFEDEIKALKTNNDKVLRLPNVATVTAGDPGPRLNLLFYALQTDTPYIMIATPSPASGPMEMELARQVRARLIAEAEVAAKSQELARTNAELTAVNAGLEQFAAIVAHDLTAPMRALRYQVDEIEASLGDAGADVAVTRSLAELRRQTSRLSSMLTTLFHYANAVPDAEALETVDTLTLVKEIVRSLPHNGMHIDIRGSWPTLQTLAAPLDVTLRNLIDNTIKHHDRDEGHLTISCAEIGNALEFIIEDDGPGIAPEHHASVFLPFRTVGNDNGGMGLAIVRRMVSAAGGTISLCSSAPEQRGTTFKIHWPVRIAL